MPTRKIERDGVLYLRGTISVGEKSRPVYVSSKIRARDPHAAGAFDAWRIAYEARVLQELLHGEGAALTWTEAAAGRLEDRANRLTAQGRAPMPGDTEAECVFALTKFFRARGVADKPLRQLTQADVDAYFRERHIGKGHALSTMHRDKNAYVSVMIYAKDRKAVGDDFPRPDLPEYDPSATPVDKWLYPEEVRLFMAEAARHFRPLLAVLWGTGRRGGELPLLPRDAFRDDEAFPQLFIGRTKNGEPVSVPLPAWVAEELRAWLAERTDAHDRLFLTDLREPYTVPRRRRAGLFKMAWRGCRRRVVKRLEAMAREQEEGGNANAARRLRARAAIIARATPHWGRHNAASWLTMKGMGDVRLDMHMGWKDPTIKRRYAHLSPEARQAIADVLDFGAPAQGAKSVQSK